MIPEYFTNVEVLTFNDYHQCEKSLLKYLPLLKKLRTLLWQCHYLPEYLLLKCLESAKSLQKLDLSTRHNSRGFWLKKINNLTHLKISNYHVIDSEIFSEFCRNNETLKYLDIGHCSGLNEENIGDIVKY